MDIANSISMRTWRFQRQLTILFSLAVLCFAVIGALLNSWMEGNRDKDNVLSQSKQITTSFARQSKLSLLYGTGENSLNEAKVMLDFPGVMSVAIYDVHGNSILQQGEKPNWVAPSTPVHETVMANETAQDWHFLAPVFTHIQDDQEISPFELNDIEPEYLGYIHLVMSKEELQTRQKETFISNLISTFLFSVALLGLLIWLTSQLTRPLNTLASLMKQAEDGESNVRATPHGPKEVLLMSRAFNKMMEVLEDRAKALDHQNNLLLKEIEEKEKAEMERVQLQQQLLQARKMEAIGHLTGGIAHDFNNILGSILGYTGLALDRFTDNGEGKLGKYLSEIKVAGERARDLVAQMLAFSRRAESSPQAIYIEPVINEVVNMLSSTFPSSIEIDQNFEKDIPVICIDPTKLHQIVMNLCINAKDAMKGQGQLILRVQQHNIASCKCTSCHVTIQGDFVELTVQDSGNGIDEKVLNQIFDPFFTTKEFGSGTGMGLSVVHGIVHESGGHIIVENAPNGGTLFRILFPTTKEVVDTGPPTSMRRQIQSEGHGHLLVVDDENSVANYYAELLRYRGYRVTVITDSLVALKYFEENSSTIDLVITDQTMPHLEGAEMATQMLSLQPELPIILCTGYSEKVDETQAKELHISAFFTKPVDAADLLNTVKQLLELPVVDS
ncbi:MAG: response regulator [Gammaproteobacteria bacterium]|nr:response regulator [Gammaproteobacteria bacterium]